MENPMNLNQFHNGLRVLTSIDRHELEAVGIIDVPKGQGVYPGCMDEPNKTWERFRADPFRFFLRCDDDKTRKIWAIIEKRGG
jgi:hypothetical protein